MQNRSKAVTPLPRVVVIGAGFGGIRVVQQLRKAPVHITMIDKRNHHLFQPLLYQVATAGLSPADIAFPIRSIFRGQKNVEVLMGEVVDIDVEKKCVLTPESSIPFDYLVVATGAQYNYFGHDDWEKLAPKLKSVADATKIREKILYAFEQAEKEPNPEIRKALMTFVLVGAGPTGVEMAGAIAELTHRALAKDFRVIDPKSARILLLDAGPRILAAFPESLAKNAQQKLESLGVIVRTSVPVDLVNESGVRAGKEMILSKNIIWTAGVKASPVGKWLKAKVDKAQRVLVEPDLSLPGQPNIFVIGDAACAYDQHGKELPGLAPVAMQAGKYVGHRIRARVAGKTSSPRFHYLDKGNLATIGRSSAIADLGKLRFSGMVAWLLWLGIHIFYLVGFRNRVLVFLQWTWSYLTFQRGARLITFSDREEKQNLHKPASA